MAISPAPVPSPKASPPSNAVLRATSAGSTPPASPPLVTRESRTMTAAHAFATATDVELLDAARAGQASAWAVLVRRYSPKMYAVARSFALDQRTSEDLVQTAWLRLLERTDQLREATSLGPWLAM